MVSNKSELFEVKTAETIEETLEQETIEETIKRKLKEKLPHISQEDLEKIAKSLLTDLAVAESRKAYAVNILYRTRKYVQGYLKNYRLEIEVVDNRYPLELHVKVYY